MCEGWDAKGVRHEDRIDYQPHPVSVTRARRRVRGVLEEWGYGELANEAELIAAELSGNAVLHGCATGGTFEVRVVVTDGTLRIEVADPSAGRWPQPRAADGGRIGGRGLAIVGHVAHRWGVTCSRLGKTVWSAFDLPH